MMIVHKNKAGLEPTKKPSAIDIAWAAGIYEGEGSCNTGGTGGRSFSVQVSQKDPELLYRLRDLFGGGVKPYMNGEWLIHHWVVCGDRGRAFLTGIYPFLTARRRAQVDATSVSVFLEFAGDLLLPTIADGPCTRYEAICKKAEEFYRTHRLKSKSKRAEYLRSYWNKRYQNDPEYRKKKLASKTKLKKSQKEQQSAEPLKIVAIA